jgi:hypothetical protein
MKLSQDILWLVALVCGALAIVLFFTRGRLWGSWRYRSEMLPQLGKVMAVYLHGELVSYRLKKHGVLLEIMCDRPEAVGTSLKLARSLSKEDINLHLQRGLAAIPESELKPWGFEKGSWYIEAITIRSDGTLGLDLGNAGDRDHVCLVSMEGGKYTFEAVDG